MLLYLTQYLAQFESGFNVFNYLTMRAIMGALTALVISFIIGPRMIKRLQVNQLGQPVRDDGPETHLLKAGTPTMGGVLVLAAMYFGVDPTVFLGGGGVSPGTEPAQVAPPRRSACAARSRPVVPRPRHNVVPRP